MTIEKIARVTAQNDVRPRADVVYLDHQATTPLDVRVRDAMAPWLAAPANPHATEHLPGRLAAAAVEQARERVAAILVCDPDEVTFTSGATEACNIALAGILAPGDRIVISAIEHPAVAATAGALARRGCELVRVGVDAEGLVDLDALEAALEGATLASVMQVNNEIGTIQPMQDVAGMCAAAGAMLHCDLTQGVGRVASPLAGGGIDYASASSHKIHGPQGIGALYVRRGARPPRALAFGGGQERDLRPGTLPVAACVGFGKACEIAMDDAGSDAAHASAMQRTMLAVLSGVEGWHVNGSMEQRVAHNLSITIAGVQADALIAALPGVAIASGSACSGGAVGTSPTLAAIGLDREAAACTVRLGFGRFTTEAEVIKAGQQIVAACASIRGPTL